MCLFLHWNIYLITLKKNHHKPTTELYELKTDNREGNAQGFTLLRRVPKLHVHFLWLHWLILVFIIFLRLTFSFLTTYFPLELRKRWCWRIQLIIGLSLPGHHYSSETHTFKTSRSLPPTNGPAFGGLMEQVSYIFSHLSVWFHVRCFSNKFQLIFTQDQYSTQKIKLFLA